MKYYIFGLITGIVLMLIGLDNFERSITRKVTECYAYKYNCSSLKF